MVETFLMRSWEVFVTTMDTLSCCLFRSVRVIILLMLPHDVSEDVLSLSRPTLLVSLDVFLLPLLPLPFVRLGLFGSIAEWLWVDESFLALLAAGFGDTEQNDPHKITYLERTQGG